MITRGGPFWKFAMSGFFKRQAVVPSGIAFTNSAVRVPVTDGGTVGNCLF